MRASLAGQLVRFTSLAVFTSSLISGVLLAQQKPPVFRARTDLIQIDVTVLKDGKPVRGLKAEDFLLLEDNKPQKIEGFAEVDIPDAPPPAAVGEHTVASDVQTNEDTGQRIFVIMVDDALGMGANGGTMPDLWALREMKKSVALFIESLSPDDEVALVYTNNGRANQGLTKDHARLVKAIRDYPEDGGGILLSLGPSCLGQKYQAAAMEMVVSSLATIRDRRKAVVYWGGFLAYPADCGGGYWDRVLIAAQEGHVTINPIDTMGLRPNGLVIDLSSGPRPSLVPGGYLSLAHDTGGHAIVNSNDFAPGIKQIFLENSSYYLMAYAPTNELEDGTFRRLKLTVRGHPDFEVRTRSNYWAPKRKSGETDSAPPPGLGAIAGVLPTSTLPLRATAAPFARAGGEGAQVTIAIGIRQPAFAARTPEQVEVLLKAYTIDGDPRGSDSQLIPITVPAARPDREQSRYEVLARVDLPKPGKYQLRLSAHSGASDTTGSVYVDVEVPDFAKDKVSLSGVVINDALASDPVAPLRILRDIVPLVPTSNRTFATSDIVTALVRVYQGGADKLMSIPLKTTILDAAGTPVFNKTETLARDRFGDARSADYQIRLPLATLKAGDQLLSFETTVGKVTARRDVRFAIR